MARCYSFLILLFVVILSLADADLRVRRTPQFSQASAQAGSFGYNPRGFGGNNFGPPRPPVFARGPQFGGGSPVFGPPRFGNSGFGNPGFGNSGFGNPGFGNPGFGNSGFGNSGFGRPRPGGSINISKSISISTGGGAGGGARSSAGGFGK